MKCYTAAGFEQSEAAVMAKHQRGHVYEASGAFFVRYTQSYAALTAEQKADYDKRHPGETTLDQRVQLSHRLCEKDKDKKRDSPKSKEVKDLARQFMATVDAQGDKPPVETKDIRIADFWEQTYLPFIERTKRPRTVLSYKKIWASHLKTHFGNTTLRLYGTGQGTKFVTMLSEKYSRYTVQHIRALASAIFSHAIATAELGEGVLSVNPWRGVKSLVKAKDGGQTPHYTIQEIQSIIAALGNCTVKHEITKDNHYGMRQSKRLQKTEAHSHPEAALLMALTFFCGLRPSEAIGLTWEDFTGDGYVHIRRAVVNGIVGPTKTPESEAKLPLIEPVPTLLKLWHPMCGSPSTGWVFPGERKGLPMNISNLINRVIRPCLKAHKLQWKGLYASRRGGATLLVDLTNGLVAAQELLRHKNMNTTAQFYKKQTQNALPAGMKLLEAKAAEAAAAAAK